MTRGLLALLALSAPHPVPAERVLEALWPNVDPNKSRPRLRTAASQIRKAMGTPCIEREGDGLVLRHVWVDTQAFESLVGQARREFILGRAESGLHLAEEAMGLYADDLFDDGAASDWLVPRRAHFRRLLGDLLIETAEESLKQGWGRAAVAAAGRVTALDPADERACRVLMHGHDALSETGASLLAFDTCKAALAETLGADPSFETYQLHRSLLRTRQHVAAPPRFVGRSDVLSSLASSARQSFADRSVTMAHVTGRSGSGKSRLMDELGMQLGVRTVLIRLGIDAAAVGDALIPRIAASMGSVSLIDGGDGPRLTVDHPTLLCLDDVWCTDDSSLDDLAAYFRSLDAPLFVVVATATPLRTARVGQDVHRLRPLAASDVALLLADVLGAPVAEATVAHFCEHADGLPGLVIDQARRHKEGGLLHPSADGLTRDKSAVLMDLGVSPSSMVEAARSMLPLAAMEVLDILAVLNEPISAEALDRLAMASGAATEWLDVLCDAGLLDLDEAGYRFAGSELRDAAYLWMRPSARRALHQHLASFPEETLCHEARLRHWVAAGSPQTGSSTTIDPLDSTTANLLPQTPLQLAVGLDSLHDATQVPERIQSLVTIMTASRQQGDNSTAARASNLAISLASRDRPAILPELYRRRARLMIPGEDSMSWCDRARMAVGPTDSLERSQIDSVTGRLVDRWSQPLAVAAHGEAVRLADASADVRQRVRARALLVGQLIAGRQINEANAVALAAADIADRSHDDALRATALRTIARAALWTWTSARYIHTLERAWPLSRNDPRIHASIALALARALHDFGREGVDDALRLARQICRDTPLESTWHLNASYIALERGRLSQCAEHLDLAMRDEQWSALSFTFLHVLRGRLLVAQGQLPEATAEFRLVMQVAQGSGASLLLGEAAGRLAIATARQDPDTAERCLNLAAQIVGAGEFPREQSLLLLARAHVALGRGRPEVALVLARTAQKAAREAKTRVAESQECVQQCLDHPTMSGRVVDVTDAATKSANPQWVKTMWTMLDGLGGGGTTERASARLPDDVRTG